METVPVGKLVGVRHRALGIAAHMGQAGPVLPESEQGDHLRCQIKV